jgi:hypothetical protein
VRRATWRSRSPRRSWEDTAIEDRASTGTLGALHVERINGPASARVPAACLPGISVGGELAHPDTFRPIG